MPYKIVTLNLSDEYGDKIGKTVSDEPYYVKFVPLEWLPTEVTALAMSIGVALDLKLKDIDTENPSAETASAGLETAHAYLPVLAEAIEDWNLTYMGERNDDGKREELRIPLPWKILKLPAEEQKSMILKAPMRVLTSLIEKITAGEDMQIPPTNGSSSLNESPTRAPQLQPQHAKLSVLDGQDPEAHWDVVQSDLREKQMLERATGTTEIENPAGSLQPA